MQKKSEDEYRYFSSSEKDRLLKVNLKKYAV